MPKFYRHFVHKAATKLGSSGSSEAPAIGSAIKKITGSSSSNNRKPTWDDNENREAPFGEYVELNHGLKGAKTKPTEKEDSKLDDSMGASWPGQQRLGREVKRGV